MSLSHNFRFIERDYWYGKALCGNEHLLPLQIEEMLDEIEDTFCDYTFKFYEDGSVTIIDNDTNNRVSPRDLTGVVQDFYIRKRIHMIRVNLEEKLLQYA